MHLRRFVEAQLRVARASNRRGLPEHAMEVVGDLADLFAAARNGTARPDGHLAPGERRFPEQSPIGRERKANPWEIRAAALVVECVFER